MSDYLPHSGGPKRLAGTMKDINAALRYMSRSFHSVLVTGQSGIIPGAIYCHAHNKNLVVLRKPGEAAHGDPLAGFMKPPYIILDDFISTGATITRLLDHARANGWGQPVALILYAQAEQQPRPLLCDEWPFPTRYLRDYASYKRRKDRQ